MSMPSSLPPEPRDITSIIRPVNVQCVIAALDPAFSIDYAGMAAVVSYAFDRETLLVGHVHRMPGAGASSLDLVREFMTFIAGIKQKSGAQWAPCYNCLDATKDRSVIDRMFELGLGSGERTAGRGVGELPGAHGHFVRWRGIAGDAGPATIREPAGPGQIFRPLLARAQGRAAATSACESGWRWGCSSLHRARPRSNCSASWRASKPGSRRRGA